METAALRMSRRRTALSTLVVEGRTLVDLGGTWLAPVLPIYPGRSVVVKPEVRGEPLKVGEIIAGRYRVERLLGSGAFGEVYLVRHTDLDALFAIKVLLPELSADVEFIERFRAEARTAAQVKHPGIVQTTDVAAMEDGRWYIVMEYLQGRSLADELDALGENPQLEISRAAWIAGQEAEAMEVAHKQGIVHRDLKPENIFLVREPGKAERVVIVDFGLAQCTRTVGGDRVEVAGSPMYMAPEQTEGKPADPRSDIYTLGVILFEKIAGRWPHEMPPKGDGSPQDLRGRIDAIYAAKRTVVPPLVSKFRKGVPPGVVTLVRDSLAINPNHRPQTMAEFGDRLRAAMVVRVTEQRTTPVRSRGVLGTLVGILVVGLVLAAGIVGWRVADPASHAEFVGVVRKAARAVGETSRPVIAVACKKLKGVEALRFLCKEEPASKPKESKQVKPASQPKAAPARKPAKRHRTKRAVTAAPDAAVAPQSSIKP